MVYTEEDRTSKNLEQPLEASRYWTTEPAEESTRCIDGSAVSTPETCTHAEANSAGSLRSSADFQSDTPGSDSQKDAPEHSTGDRASSSHEQTRAAVTQGLCKHAEGGKPDKAACVAEEDSQNTAAAKG